MKALQHNLFTVLTIIVFLASGAANAQELNERLGDGATIEHVKQDYKIGDLNHDGIADIATAIFDRTIAADSSIVNDCGKNICEIKIAFSSGIPDIVFEGYDTVLETAPDVNGDGAPELIVFRWWLQCCWIYIDLYTFKNNKWEEIATTEAFAGGSQEDYENRVQKIKGHYYLMGEKWARNYSEVVRKKTKIKVK